MRSSNVIHAWLGAVILSVALVACEGAATSSGTPVPADSASEPPQVIASEAAPVPTTTGLEGVALHGVAASNDGVVAVGSDGDAAAWASTDRMAWHPIDVVQAEDAEALHAVGLDGEGVAFGAAGAEASRTWSASAGSQPWEPIDSHGIDGRVNAVATDTDRWVAVGDLVDDETGTTEAGAVWTSDSGRRWEPLTELPLNEGTVSDVVVGGNAVVVTGFDVDGGKVWISTSGSDLEPVEDDQFSAASIEGIAHTDVGYVALGRTLGELRPVVWTSPDAMTWHREDVSTDVFAPDLQINDLTTVDGELLGVGAAPEGGAIWTSDDGVTWTFHGPTREPTGATEDGS